MAPQQRSSRSNAFTNSLRRRNTDSRSPINPFVKYFLFFTNFILMVVGAGAIAFSIYILVEKDKAIDHIIYFLFDPACWILLGGCIIFVLNTLGAYGALRENVCILKAYYILFSIVLLLELILIILVFVFFFYNDAFTSLGIYPEDTIKEAIKKYRDDEDMRNFIDDIQEEFSCCGYSKDDEGYLNWNDNIYFACNKTDPSFALNPEACSVPHSCCRTKNGDAINYQCGKDMLDPDTTGRSSKIYVQGCLKAFEQSINDNIWIIGGIVIGIFIIQMIFIWFAKALVAQIEEQMMKW